MSIEKITAKTLLRKSKKIDSWFLSKYGMNIYRGCTHNCVYCDGRTEKYNVNGVFEKDIAVKINAPELLVRELEALKRKGDDRSGMILLGGGVADSYQPAEEKYVVTRNCLEIISEYGYPVHILTKSLLVERDLDILEKIRLKKGTVLSFSFSSTDDGISSIFEPGVPAPSEKLKLIKKLKSKGFTCGVFLMPVIPFITDLPEMIDKTLYDLKKASVDFVIFGGLTLKPGRQKEYFMNVLKENFPNLMTEYDMLYGSNNKYGGAMTEYYDSIYATFDLFSGKYKMAKRIPQSVYDGFLNETDKVIVILEHIDYVLKSRGGKSPYGYAAYSISKIKEPISNMRFMLKSLKGVGRVTEKLILEILDTGKCSYYENLM